MKLTLAISSLAVVLVTTGIFVNARAHSTAPARGKARPILVELFTSEGCSSCPSADALLRQLNGTKSSEGQLIIGLSEHVTYWNNNGWSDPFSKTAFTDRQYAYGQKFHLDSVYTPQAVVNGREQLVGSDSDALYSAFKSEAGSTPFQLDIVSASPSGNRLNITYSISGQVPASGADIYAAVADDLKTSHVRNGENSGRNLSHVSVARNLMRVGSIKSDGTVNASIPIASAASVGAGTHLVVFAQAPNLGRVYSVDIKSL